MPIRPQQLFFICTYPNENQLNTLQNFSFSTTGKLQCPLVSKFGKVRVIFFFSVISWLQKYSSLKHLLYFVDNLYNASYKIRKENDGIKMFLESDRSELHSRKFWKQTDCANRSVLYSEGLGFKPFYRLFILLTLSRFSSVPFYKFGMLSQMKPRSLSITSCNLWFTDRSAVRLYMYTHTLVCATGSVDN